MNKHKNRLLQDPDPVLWQQSEKEENRLKNKICEWSLKRVKYLSKKLIKLKKKLGRKTEIEEEYYKLRDELVLLCQKGFLGLGLSNTDRNWVREGLTCLLELYDDLITGISRNFVAKHQNQIDFSEVKSYAQQLFMRLITGDTPWAIKVFMNQDKPSQETKAALSEIKIHKKKKGIEKETSLLIKNLREQNLHPDDIKLAKYLFQEDMKDFSEWAKQPTHAFSDWVKSIIHHQIRKRQEMLSLGLIIDKKRTNRFQQDIQKLTRVLRDENLFQALIEKNHLFFEKEYRKYKKSCYKDEKYTRYDRGNFTTFIRKYLPLRLTDLYRRKELIEKIQIPLEETTGIEEKPDFISNIYTNETIETLLPLLTPVERKVFKLRLKGWENVKIAKKRGISKSRVSQIRKNISQKALKVGLSPD